MSKPNRTHAVIKWNDDACQKEVWEVSANGDSTLIESRSYNVEEYRERILANDEVYQKFVREVEAESKERERAQEETVSVGLIFAAALVLFGLVAVISLLLAGVEAITR